MKRKGKLISCIVAIILILLLMGFGIWAVAKDDIGIGGDINFDAIDLEATISGKVYGHHADHLTYDTAEELPGATWTKNTAQDGIQNNLDWSNLHLDFVDKDTDIVIEIKITNNHPEKAILVGVKDNTDVEDKNFTVTIEGTGSATSNVIAIGETITYTVTLKVVDKNQIVNGNLDITFSLTNEM